MGEVEYHDKPAVDGHGSDNLPDLSPVMHYQTWGKHTHEFTRHMLLNGSPGRLIHIDPDWLKI